MLLTYCRRAARQDAQVSGRGGLFPRCARILRAKLPCGRTDPRGKGYQGIMKSSYARRSTAKAVSRDQESQRQPTTVASSALTAAGLTLTQSMILQLQRTAGNAAVNALLRQCAQA